MKYLLVGQTIDCDYEDTYDVFDSIEDAKTKIKSKWDIENIDEVKDDGTYLVPLCDNPQGMFVDNYVYKVFPYREKSCIVINRGDSTESNTEDYKCLFGDNEYELCQKASDTIRKLFGEELLKETFNSFSKLKAWEENTDDDMFHSEGWNLRIEIFE